MICGSYFCVFSLRGVDIDFFIFFLCKMLFVVFVVSLLINLGCWVMVVESFLFLMEVSVFLLLLKLIIKIFFFVLLIVLRVLSVILLLWVKIVWIFGCFCNRFFMIVRFLVWLKLVDCFVIMLSFWFVMLWNFEFCFCVVDVLGMFLSFVIFVFFLSLLVINLVVILLFFILLEVMRVLIFFCLVEWLIVMMGILIVFVDCIVVEIVEELVGLINNVFIFCWIKFFILFVCFDELFCVLIMIIFIFCFLVFFLMFFFNEIKKGLLSVEMDKLMVNFFLLFEFVGFVYWGGLSE